MTKVPQFAAGKGTPSKKSRNDPPAKPQVKPKGKGT